MSQMKTFPPPMPSDEEDKRSGKQRGLLLMLALYSNPNLLSVVRAAVERLTETLGFPAVQRRSITRAVDEAVTNIVRHTYGNQPDQPIAVYFRRAQRGRQGEIENGLEILLCDCGPPVDLNKLRGRRLDEIRPGGLGLHFIRQAMDTVEFARKGPTNRMRLVKYLAQTADSR